MLVEQSATSPQASSASAAAEPSHGHDACEGAPHPREIGGLYLPMLWIFWSVSLSEVNPWGMYFLVALIVLTLLTPVWFIYRSSQFSGDMARLTPAYDRPEGH